MVFCRSCVTGHGSLMTRFFVNRDNVGVGSIIIDDPGDVHHIRDVLRMKTGDEIVVSDSDTWEYRCSISAVGRTSVDAGILDKQKFAGEPDVRITLFQGMPKKDKLELIVQKATELGAAEIVPVFTGRTVVARRENFGKKIERLEKIALSAAKQCGRGKAPRIDPGMDLKEMPEVLKRFQVIIFPYENEDSRTIKEALRGIGRKPDEMAVIIGPEGGFAEEEALLLKNAGAESVTLGNTILRTETAGIAALAMCMYELEL